MKTLLCNRCRAHIKYLTTIAIYIITFAAFEIKG
jgi:hypothetical protein